jgi:hypothetical protein
MRTFSIICVALVAIAFSVSKSVASDRPPTRLAQQNCTPQWQQRCNQEQNLCLRAGRTPAQCCEQRISCFAIGGCDTRSMGCSH